MKKIWMVARREYIAQVRTKSFIVGIVLLPVLLLGSIYVQKWLDKASVGGEPAVLVDAGTGLGQTVLDSYVGNDNYELSLTTVSEREVEATVADLTAKVAAKKLSGFLVMLPGLVEGSGEVHFYTDNVSRREPRRSILSALQEVVRRQRFNDQGLDQALIAKLYAPVSTRDFDLSEEGVEVDAGAREAMELIPMIFVYLMFIGIMSYGQAMLTSTVEEKSNRVMEVLLSSVSSFQLMAGKILGFGMVSLTLMTLWLSGGAFAILHFHLQALIQWSTLGYFILFYIPGFMLFTSVMAALGSLCNDLKEAQNLQTPVMVVLMLPLFIMFWVGQHPDHIIGRILSFIPIFTPFLMVNRIASAQPPGIGEILAANLVLWGGILLVVWMAARVFRVGVLMYGKPPALREVARWIREA